MRSEGAPHTRQRVASTPKGKVSQAISRPTPANSDPHSFMAKYDEIVASHEAGRHVVLPRFYRREDAGRYVGAPHLFTLMEDAGWIAPVVQKNRMTLFDREQILHCCQRIVDGEFPATP